LLPAVEYAYADGAGFYHYEIKHERLDDLEIRVPALLTAGQEAELAVSARAVFDACSVRGFARADFRVADDGTLWFLEVNALPSLVEGSGMYAAAAEKGLGAAEVVEAIVESTLRRDSAGVAP
jgi:D-alanine-D-alanine ligase